MLTRSGHFVYGIIDINFFLGGGAPRCLQRFWLYLMSFFSQFSKQHFNGVFPLQIKVRLRLHISLVAHQAGAYPSFLSMKEIEIFLPSPTPLLAWTGCQPVEEVPPPITFRVKFTSSQLIYESGVLTKMMCSAIHPGQRSNPDAQSGIQPTNP